MASQALFLGPAALAATELTDFTILVAYTDRENFGAQTQCFGDDLKPLTLIDGAASGSFSHTFDCDLFFPSGSSVGQKSSLAAQFTLTRVPGTDSFNITASASWTNATGGFTEPQRGPYGPTPFCTATSSTATTIAAACQSVVFTSNGETFLDLGRVRLVSNRSHSAILIFGAKAVIPPTPSVLNLGAPVSLRGATLAPYRSSTTLANPTFQDVSWTAAPVTDSGGSWLSITPSSGTLKPGEEVTLAVTGDPRVVPPGQTADKCPSSTGFPGRIVVNAAGGAGSIPVNLFVSNVVPTKIQNADFRRAPGEWRDLTPNILLGEGDEVSVDPDGLVTLTFPDSSAVDLGPLTQIKITAFCQAGGVVQTEILQAVGNIQARVTRQSPQSPRSSFDIRSPTAIAGVRGTVFGVSYDPGTGLSAVTVKEGVVEVTPVNAALAPLTLQAGQQAQFSPTAISPVSALGSPLPSITAVNAASFVGPLTRGSLASLFGANLANEAASATTLPLSTTLGGAQLRVGGILAPLVYASPTQINFQVPFETPFTGNIPIEVTVNGAARASVNMIAAEYAPGVFAYYRTAGYFDPIITHVATNALVTAANPAQPGEALVIYATGVGNLTDPPATGVASSATTLARAAIDPVVTLAGAPLAVLFAGLTPGFAGLVQINVVLPETLPAGVRLPLVVAFGAKESRPIGLSVITGSPTASLRAAISTLDFGNVLAGQHADLPLSIANLGAAALSIASLTTGNAAFTMVGSLPGPIPPGDAATITVRYSPSAAGASAATLTIASNDPASPALVSLTGTGTVAQTP